MRKKLFTLLLAVAASVGTMFAWDYKRVQIGDLYYNLDATSQTAEVYCRGFISINDNSIDDWKALPAEKVASCECPTGATLLGLKGVAVYADELYINILVEYDPEDIPNHTLVPFHVYINTDNSDATGGSGDQWNDANVDIMMEGFFFSAKEWDGETPLDDGAPCAYDPVIVPWIGEVGGSGWGWGDILDPAGPCIASQHVTGNFVEIQMLRELVPTLVGWNDNEFGIGFDIQQSWESVGILPLVSPTDDNPTGHTVKLQVTICNTPYAEISGDIVIPETVNYDGVTYSVTSIGESAFQGCSGLTSVTIPNSVTSIGWHAFQNCSGLTSVTLNSNAIVSQAYSNYNSLKDIFGVQVPKYFIGDGVTSIGANAFSGCSGLTSVTFPNSVTSIGQNAFSGCKIDNIYISGTMEEWLNKSWTPGQVSYSYSLFINDVAVTNVVIPNSVTSIGNSAFSGCSSLTSVTIPNSVTSIGGAAFLDCTSLTSVTIPNSVTSIGDRAFTGCSGLTSIEIPNSVTSIGAAAFCDCSNLKNVIIGSSVKVLEESAFYRCSAIETITCYGQRPPTVKQNALYDLDYSTIVYVPADYLETYKMHDAWGLYDVRPLGAKSTETTDVNVTPAENTADVAWPTVSGAATYELVIKDKSGNVVCTLIFNANGQLTSIAFAPSRNGAPQQTQAAGFSFTVTGLEEGTSYDLTITSKDNNGGTLDTKTISFTTTGEAQGIEEISAEGSAPQKVMIDGQVFILRGDKTYTLQGQEVK